MVRAPLPHPTFTPPRACSRLGCLRLQALETNAVLLGGATGGPDVYQGLVPDYTGADVTSETFLAVLTGNKNAVNGKGNGKVIASGPNDRVFVFYSDHGAPGILGMPSGGCGRSTVGSGRLPWWYSCLCKDHSLLCWFASLLLTLLLLLLLLLPATTAGGFLYADHLLDAIKVKRRNGGFKEVRAAGY